MIVTFVIPGNDQWAVKDPVIIRDHEGWRMWVCCHPLGEAGHEDRMITRYTSSVDGLDWHDQGVALRGHPRKLGRSWRARITAILNESPLTMLYDGRASRRKIGVVNGQFVVPAGGQVKVPSLRVFLSGC